VKENKIQIPIIDNYYMNVHFDQLSDSLTNQDLFKMALRLNKKRSFLFVSKLLGKHIPVMPQKALLTGKVLAALYAEHKGNKVKGFEDMLSQLAENHNPIMIEQLLESKIDIPHETLVLGFAETATGLGHSVFSAFKKNAYYLHTTREKVNTGIDPIIFYEEHSHATEHRIYSYENELFESDCEILLVDDEISTGKTILNIIRAIQAQFPRKTYQVLTILDWRNSQAISAFKELEKELNITIHVHAIAKGEFELCNEVTYDQLTGYVQTENPGLVQENIESNVDMVLIDKLSDHMYDFLIEDFDETVKYLKWSGRFGIGIKEQADLEALAKSVGKDLMSKRTGNRTLCLGTGEFIYIPMLIASHMGDNIMYHSTTRSPILPLGEEAYGAKQAYTFQNPFNDDLTNYFYNIEEDQYDDVFVFIEKPLSSGNLDSMIKALKQTGIKGIKLVSMTQ